MSQTNRRIQTVALMGLSLAVVVGFAPLFAGFVPPAQGAPGSGTTAVPVFSFVAAGDFGGAGNGDTLALAKRAKAANASFLLALGDLGYTSDAQGWCNSIKGQFNDVVVVAGNHDTSESGPGDISQNVVYCPFTLGVPLTAGPGTPGYGYEYYFDYPSTNPVARIIMISPGVGGALNYDYGVGSTHYNWVATVVTDARAAGIPWVVAGMHKICIVSGDKSSCEMGQAIFDKLVDLKVDLILQAHAHVYERGKQLAISGACPSVLSANQFDPDCVVDDGADAFYPRGIGSVVAISGTGGESVRSATLSNSSDKERDYFVELMGSNENTQGKSWGYGYTQFSVSAEDITVKTDFCPPGTAGSDGQCPSQQSTVFRDQFQIGGTPPPPGPLTADFTFAPSNPYAGQTVTFASTVSGGTSPYGYAWTFGDGGTTNAANPTHVYGSTGPFTVAATVTDVVSTTVTVSKAITVSSPPAPGEIPINGFRGQYYDNEDLTNLKLERIDNAVNFNWGSGSPDPSIAVDTYSARWEGYWDYAQGGIYRFTIMTDDGIRISVDNTTQVLDAWFPQTPTTYTQDVEVSSGRHFIKVEWFERTNTAIAQVSWAYFGASAGSPPVTTASLAGTRGAAAWFVSPVDIVLTATDPSGLPVLIKYRLDGGAWTTYVASFRVGEARHTFDYYAINGAGVQESTKSMGVDVDTIPPILSGLGPSGFVVDHHVEVSWYSSDAASGLERFDVSVDGAGFVAVAMNTRLVLELEDGGHNVFVKALDVAGNEAVAVASFRVETNIISPTGPYGIPVFLIVEFVAAAVTIAVMRRHHRRRVRLST